MHLARQLRLVGSTLALTGALVAAGVSLVGAAPLRSPQVPLLTGWDGISLQTYLNGVGESLNTLTDQLDLPTWQSPGGGTFTLMMEIAGYAGQNTIGIYNAGEPSPPTRFPIFPGAAPPGWYASCVFTPGGNLTVSLYDGAHVLQGITNFTGVDPNNFGFYLKGPAGTFYSQDYRNPGGKPQVLTYEGTGPYLGRWWECFEDLPYASSDVDFQDSILLLQAVLPTPAGVSSWGRLKSLYR